jgi:glutamate-5-semialdehyde dehydrogenase
MLDRLKLNPERIQGMAKGVREVAALPDPVGAVLETKQHPKGFRIDKLRVPIGVIGIIYESRPNVTVDCAVLCLKSGNATILRGGKEAFHSNSALIAIIHDALRASGLDTAAVQLIPTTDRAALQVLLKADQFVHCLIPRGGEGLIRFVAENARMPVIKHYKGLCHVYVHEDALPDRATEILINAKCQRPGVCNAAETLLVDAALLHTWFPNAAHCLHDAGVELRLDPESGEALGDTIPWSAASSEDFDTEYLDKIISVKTVSGPEAAIDFINTHGSMHSEAIVTENASVAKQFLSAVDAAAVYWNVSTRFTDGYEFGLGAEIGISTDKLHARGPMGLNELTTYKFIATGSGQIK